MSDPSIQKPRFCAADDALVKSLESAGDIIELSIRRMLEYAADEQTPVNVESLARRLADDILGKMRGRGFVEAATVADLLEQQRTTIKQRLHRIERETEFSHPKATRNSIESLIRDIEVGRLTGPQQDTTLPIDGVA